MKHVIFILLIVGNVFAQTVKTELVYKVKQPTTKSSKTPVIIMLHGYGSNESDLFDLSTMLDERYIVFSLRAPLAAKDQGFCWYSLEFLPNQQFKHNYTETIESRKKIMSFISNACKAYGIDSTQVFLMGFSQGAIMAYDIAVSNPKKIKGVMALSGLMLTETAALKTDALKLAEVKFYIAHGYSDNVIKIAEAEKANEYLKLKKVKDLLYINYEMPHSICGNELNDIKKWFVNTLKSKERSKN
jgi:phospholipase/carboxylesterase